MSSGFRYGALVALCSYKETALGPCPPRYISLVPSFANDCKFNGNQKAARSREHSPNYAVSLWLSAHHQDLLIFALKAPPTTVIRKMLKVSRTLEVKQLFVSAIYLIALPSCLLKETLP